MSVTLKDIAERAKVSVAAVSRVVNHGDTSICSEETQRLIWQLANELGYQPRERKKKAPKPRIGYVLYNFDNDSRDPYYANIIKGIEIEAIQSDAQLALTCLSANLYGPSQFSGLIADSQADAIIFVADHPHYKELLRQSGKHIVLAGAENSFLPRGFDFVGVDLYGDVYRFLSSCVIPQYERVAYVGLEVTDRFRAYSDSHVLNGRPLRQPYAVFTQGWGLEDGKQAVSRALAGWKELPQVIFGASDALAAGAILALREQGIGVPEQVKVFGLDNTELAHAMELSAIGLPMATIGRAAVRAAISWTSGERDYPMKWLLATEFVERESFRLE